MEKNDSFLGRGWSFPPHFKKEIRGAVMLEEEKDIRSSLEILLSTRLGERVMRPDFGCALDDLQFEPLNTSLQTYIADIIRRAILFYEPRIELERIDLSESDEWEGVVLISLDYRVRTTNSRANLVYPFYKDEGTIMT